MRTGEQWRVSELRYRRLFETAQGCILILDADTGTDHRRQPLPRNMLEDTHTEMLGKALWEIGPFKDIARVRAAI